jgi:hypothetical protein
VAFALTWLAATIYLAVDSRRDWIPHDDGSLAHSAERVLEGELPHRDYDELYTGGLTFYHAAAMNLLGCDLLSLRIALLLATLAVLPALYYLIAQAASPLPAAVVTLGCVIASVPNYAASMPSWYNTFLAVAGTAALVRFAQTRHSRWLLLAGLCGGVSVVIKISGLYYVAAVLLYLTYWNQTEPSPRRRTAAGRWYLPCVGAALLMFIAVLVGLISRRPSLMDSLHFALPGILLAAWLVVGEWRVRGQAGGLRCRRLMAAIGTFLAGFALPVLVFLLPYLEEQAWRQLMHGVFVLPRLRFEMAALPMPPLVSLIAALPLAGVLGWAVCLPRMRGGRLALGIGGGLAICLALMGAHPNIYTWIWYSLRPTVPLLTLAGCCVLAWPRRFRGRSRDQRRQLFLILAMAAMGSLIQFPFAAGVYFLYAAPLVIVAGLFLSRCLAAEPRRGLVCFFFGYTLFALLWLNQASTYHLGFRYLPLPMTRLDLPRGGIHVPTPHAETYRWLVAEIQKETTPGTYIYALPDSPEVYFLANRRNPTRTFFDFFDSDFATRPQVRTARILERLEECDVQVVVMRRHVEFSRQVPTLLRTELQGRYPYAVEGLGFVVRRKAP